MYIQVNLFKRNNVLLGSTGRQLFVNTGNVKLWLGYIVV